MTTQLTPAQQRMLDRVRAEGPRTYNYRAASQITALEAAGLITADWDAVLDETKGRLRWRITVTAVQADDQEKRS